MTNNARTATINGTLSFTSATGTKTLANVAVTSIGTLTNSVARTIAIQNLTLTDGATINGTGSLTINAAGSLFCVVRHIWESRFRWEIVSFPSPARQR